MNEAGNGVSVWNAPGAKVLDNDIRFGRDGIFVDHQQAQRLQRQPLPRPALRHPLHVHQRQRDQRTTSRSATRSASRSCISQPPEDHAATSRTATATTASCSTTPTARRSPATWCSAGSSRPSAGRRRHARQGRRGARPAGAGRRRAAPGADARAGPEKCVFIYNANQNRFRDNWFEGCEIGIHFTAGSEGNEIVGNAFISNRNQVKYVGTRYLDWSKDGRGNYWSDNPAFDLERRRHRRQRLPAERPRRQGAVDRAAGQGPDQQPRRAGDPLGAGAVPGPAAGRRGRQPSPDGAARRARRSPKEAGHDRDGRDPQRRQALRQGRGGARRLLQPAAKARRWRSSATTAPARPR